MAELQAQDRSPSSLAQHQSPLSSEEKTTSTPSVVELKSASCKYRWGKVVPTSSKRIIFFCSAHPKEPVFLHWSSQHEAYYSEEATVVCGDYAGHVIVEGKTFPVEPFTVRSYTFEVDLFLREDVIEDEVATNNSVTEELKFQQQQQQKQQQGPVDTYRDINSLAFTISPVKMEENGSAVDDSGIRHTNKYEDLLRLQLQHKDSLDASLENELASQKTDQLAGGSGSKRLTPVGDIDKEPFQDGYTSLPINVGDSGAFDSSLLARSSERHTPQNTFSGSASDLRQDFDMDRHSVKSFELSASRHSFGDSPAADTGLPKPPSRAGSDYSGGLGSGHLTPKQDSYEPVGGNRPGSVTSPTSMDRRIDDVLGASGSLSSSSRQALTREAIGDVLGNEAILANPSRPFSSSSPRHTPERDAGSSRSTPLREMVSTTMRGSQERLYGSQELTSLGEAPSLPGSRPGSQLGSRPGSQQGSRAQSLSQSLSSLTSEQELCQFWDTNNSHPVVGKRAIPLDTHPDESASLPPIMRERDRPSSLPAHSTQSPIGAGKRGAYTPDYGWSVLGREGGMGDTGFQRDLPPRGTSKSAVSSRASSRTVTPVSAGIDREDSAKLRDLEETVATLRKLLSSREQEVHELTAQMRDLKDINHSLKNDLDHARSRRLPAGSEDLQGQYEHLRQEKEILAGEVVKLRDRLESTRGTGVDSFSSQSSTTMQRRMDEMEAHIRNLRHSQDSTTQKLLRSEKRVRELTEENNKLRSSSAQHIQDLPDDKSGRYEDRYHQVEVHQLKEDVRTLRDRNYTLQDEILKTRDGKDPYRSMDLRSREPLRDFSGRSLMTSSARGDEGVRQRPGPESSSVRESSGLHLSDLGRPRHLSPSDPPASPGRRLDRSYGSDTFPSISSRDPLQRDRSFGSDQGPREGLRDSVSYPHCRLENGERERGSSDKLAKYRDYREERETDVRRSSNRYDLHRSRPDGEVSEKVRASDSGRYGSLSAEKLRSFDREREWERERDDSSKSSMSAERLRILEEAERNRERRVQATSSAGRRTVSADHAINSQDFYRSVVNRFGSRRDFTEREKYSSPLHGSLPSSLCTDKTSLSDLFAANDSRQRKSEGNHSDDSDSTAVLMSFDVKADPFSGHREREKSTYSERSRSQDTYYDRAYLADREQEKQRDREFRGGHRETNGDDSDTATDILLSAEPGKMALRPSPRRRHRRSSVGDDASLSSLSDGEEPQDSLRRRSKSADPKGKKGPSSAYGQTTSLRPAASTEMLGGGSKTVTLSSGFRSVTPQPMATQHNKTAMMQQQASLASSLTQGLTVLSLYLFQFPDPRSDSSVSISSSSLTQGLTALSLYLFQFPDPSSLTQGLRPFAPRSPADLRSDDVVKFSRQGGKLSQGTVKFVGHLPGRSDVYLGVELYKEEGKHDGTFEGIRYFKCKPSKGVFVAFNKIVMAWAPN
ncbi:hypothetical protein ACOMHN_004259 [Nucella lapillus]